MGGPRRRKGGVLLYGAYGYTGRLLAGAILRDGLPLTLGGRREEPLAALGKELGLPVRAFPLDDPARVAAELAPSPPSSWRPVPSRRRARQRSRGASAPGRTTST